MIGSGSMLGPYQIVNLLGCGSFASVWLAEEINEKKTVALKISNKQSLNGRPAAFARNEAAVMREVSHESNLELLHYFETTDSCVMVTPYVRGGDMLTWLREQRKLPERRARTLFLKLVQGVQHAHRCGYVHRDIKLENILLNDAADQPYLADWGFAGPWSEDVLQV